MGLDAFHEAYQDLLERRIDFFAVYPDFRLTVNYTLSHPIDIVPGSFNPLHGAHREIYGRLIWDHNRDLENTFFEISIQSAIGKPPIEFDDLMERVKQFAWYAPVLVTNAPLFREKAVHFNNATFWIGADVANAFILHDGTEGIAKIPADFMIVPRGAYNLPENLPSNMHWVDWWLSPEVAMLSSTELRNKENENDL